MALIALLRGVNVGGHRRFRPSRLAHQLRRFDVVNVGAAGTFVVRHPGSRRAFRTALLRHLPVATEIVFCDGRNLLPLETTHPFGPDPADPGVTRFVSFLTRRGRTRPTLPIALPAGENWLVRVVAWRDRLVFGEYRRHMRTIRYLGQLDRMFGVPATTRNWNTIRSILRVLTEQGNTKDRPVACFDRRTRSSSMSAIPGAWDRLGVAANDARFVGEATPAFFAARPSDYEPGRRFFRYWSGTGFLNSETSNFRRVNKPRSTWRLPLLASRPVMNWSM